MAFALFEYTSDQSDQRVLSFQQGAEMFVLEENYENSPEWSLVRLNGKVGLVPNSYIQISGNPSSSKRVSVVPSLPPPKVDLNRLTTKFGPEIVSQLVEIETRQADPKRVSVSVAKQPSSPTPSPQLSQPSPPQSPPTPSPQPPNSPGAGNSNRASMAPIRPPRPPSVIAPASQPSPAPSPPSSPSSPVPLQLSSGYVPSANRHSLNINPNNMLTRKTKKIDFRRASTIYATLAQTLVEEEEEDDVVIDADFASRFQSWMDKK